MNALNTGVVTWFMMKVTKETGASNGIDIALLILLFLSVNSTISSVPWNERSLIVLISTRSTVSWGKFEILLKACFLMIPIFTPSKSIPLSISSVVPLSKRRLWKAFSSMVDINAASSPQASPRKVIKSNSLKSLNASLSITVILLLVKCISRSNSKPSKAPLGTENKLQDTNDILTISAGKSSGNAPS